MRGFKPKHGKKSFKKGGRRGKRKKVKKFHSYRSSRGGIRL